MPKSFKAKGTVVCVNMSCCGIYYRLRKSILDFMSMKSNGPLQNVVFTRGGNCSFAHRGQDANFRGKKENWYLSFFFPLSDRVVNLHTVVWHSLCLLLPWGGLHALLPLAIQFNCASIVRETSSHWGWGSLCMAWALHHNGREFLWRFEMFRTSLVAAPSGIYRIHV